jgi:hypothetical protein
MTEQGHQLFIATDGGEFLSFNGQTGKQQWDDQIAADTLQVHGNVLLVTNSQDTAGVHHGLEYQDGGPTVEASRNSVIRQLIVV